jgi:hypothetical protein
MSEQSHKMLLKTTYPSGAEEWICEECGRRFVAQWAPKFRRIILVEGDEMSSHVAQGSDLQELASPAAGEVTNAQNINLRDVWKPWFDKMGFDLNEDQEPHI